MVKRRKVMSREKPPAPVVEIDSGGRLVPQTPYDQERIMLSPYGTAFDLIARKRQPNKQVKLYWMVLHKVCEATGHWPRAENLHNRLKMQLGYVNVSFDLMTKRLEVEPDSTAAAEMSPEDFNIYFNRAMSQLAYTLGYDPMSLLPERE